MSETTTMTRRDPEEAGAPAGREPADRALVECESLVRIYQAEGIEVQALQGLDLRVEPREVVAVVGASGSGKSTLLGILSGLDTPTAGRVRVGSWDLTAMTRAQRVTYRRETVGFVWQQATRNLLPYLTAAQNVDFPQAVAGVPRAARAARTRELLAMLGIEECADRRPGQLSGGQQQRVAIAVGLANGPELLLADEPTGELDTTTSAEVLAALRTANAELGTTIVVVTHDPGVSEHVRRTVAIRDGRTSSEVVRSTRTRDDGTEHTVAEEFAVLDRAGRVQLPREYRAALDLVGRVRLALEEHQITVRSGREN
ncbi:ABC transporter ATP-binding protein [Myceligenerans crystallogenes]|uniref:ABC transporter ATP-binding protein n=1 Tax=Myceligenerans crystallogenes TaxID=316335 RepID=A0ABN2NMB5_9MICO